jgi:hypothetical protein
MNDYEHEDPLSAAKGILFAIAVSLAFWTLVVLGIWFLIA